MCDTGRFGYPLPVQLNWFGAEIFKEADALSEEDGDEVKMDFVEQARLKVLLGGVGTTHDHDVSIPGGGLCLCQRACGTVRDEIVGRSALFDDRGLCPVGEHKAGGVKGRVIAPKPHAQIEHATAHDESPRVFEFFRLPRLDLGSRLAAEHPVVENLERLKLAVGTGVIFGSGDETIERHADVEDHFSHVRSPFMVT